MKKFCLYALLLFVTHIAAAQTKVVQSSVTYEIKNLGVATNGKFGTVKANVNFNPADLAKSTIEASIDAASINSDNDTRDEHLKGEKFFDVTKYPLITMKSTAFKSKGGNKFEGTFNLTIKGTTKAVTLPFTYDVVNNTAKYRGSFKINRKDFKVGGNSMPLADEAIITLALDTEK